MVAMALGYAQFGAMRGLWGLSLLVSCCVFGDAKVLAEWCVLT